MFGLPETIYIYHTLILKYDAKACHCFHSLMLFF